MTSIILLHHMVFLMLESPDMLGQLLTSKSLLSRSWWRGFWVWNQVKMQLSGFYSTNLYLFKLSPIHLPWQNLPPRFQPLEILSIMIG
ncbi:desiccation-related protein pcc13-62 [Phtheirospermum japonicum]|uniref:Desiccation-related protein pcc13-62 n=1 Tax=Phtheirospermum japonicum TaxID=374723 RepID=A0A830CQJ6_9LAMI|nr:desiccation-related protein pcc13-62 [Phtheirospermum japonicum]